jgi:hypothetical protein
VDLSNRSSPTTMSTLAHPLSPSHPIPAHTVNRYRTEANHRRLLLCKATPRRACWPHPSSWIGMAPDAAEAPRTVPYIPHVRPIRWRQDSRSRDLHCRRGIPAIAAGEMPNQTSSRPIKPPGAPPRNPSTSTPLHFPSGSLHFSKPSTTSRRCRSRMRR